VSRSHPKKKVNHSPMVYVLFCFGSAILPFAMCVLFESKFHFSLFHFFIWFHFAGCLPHQAINIDSPRRRYFPLLSFEWKILEDAAPTLSFFRLSANWKSALCRRWTFSFLVKRTNFNFTSACFQTYTYKYICIYECICIYPLWSCEVNYMCMAIWQLHLLAAHL